MISLLISALITCSFATQSHSENLLHNSPLSTDPPISVVMQYSSEKNGKAVEKEGGLMTLTVNGAKAGIIMELEGNQTQIIWDNDSNKMITVTSDKKGKQIAMIMPRISFGQKDIEDYVGDIQRTDETKKILGYDTRKYILTNKDGITEAWLANIPEVNWTKLSKCLTGADGKGMKKNFVPVIPEMPDALALASKTTSTNGKQVSYMEIKEISSGSDVDLSRLEIPKGAEVQDLSSMMKF